MVFAIAVLGIFFYQDSQDRVIAARQVSHAHRVICKTEAISSAFKNAQLRAIQLADLKDAARTTDYQIAMRGLYLRMAELRNLITRNGKGVSIDSFQGEMQRYIQVSDSLKAYIDISPDAGKALKAMQHGTMARKIELMIEDIKEAEVNVLVERNLALQKRVDAFMRTFTMLTITILSITRTNIII